MKKLQVLMVLLWCILLALPLQASAVTHNTQTTTNQSVAPTENSSAGLLFQEINPTDPEALLVLNETLLTTIVPGLLKQLYTTSSAAEPLIVSPATFRSGNGLHVIFTAGP